MERTIVTYETFHGSAKKVAEVISNKLNCNLINIDTEEYTIELIDGISNRIFDSQNGNENGEHNFTIATDMDESHLEHYSIKVKFNNGEVKDFGNIKVEIRTKRQMSGLIK